MDNLSYKMCDIQGRLFELAAKEGYDSEIFASAFMKSDIARGLDSEYNRMQWMGEEYLLEELVASYGIPRNGNTYQIEAMYWSGYLYRFWHYFKSDSSRNIYRTAKIRTMNRNYAMFHTMAPESAIEDLIALSQQKKK